MQLTIIGSGSCVPTLFRGSPCNFLKIGKTNILVDCGPGAIRQLEKVCIDYKEIDAVFITHFHTDHISDLNALIQALQWTPGFTRTKDLIIIGPVGIKQFYSEVILPMSKKPETFSVKIKEIKNKISFKEYDVFCCKTNHNDVSIAYKFKENNKTLVISGDTGFDETFISFCKQCDVLLLECSFSNNNKTKGHLTPQECGTIAKQAHAQKLILTHLYPLQSETRLDEARRVFSNTIMAEDCMIIDI